SQKRGGFSNRPRLQDRSRHSGKARLPRRGARVQIVRAQALVSRGGSARLGRGSDNPAPAPHQRDGGPESAAPGVAPRQGEATPFSEERSEWLPTLARAKGASLAPRG